MENNKSTRINNTQRAGLVRLVENKNGKLKDNSTRESKVEEAQNSRLTELKKKFALKIKLALEGKKAEKELEKDGVDIDSGYSGNYSVGLTYSEKSKVEAKFEKKENNLKEKAVRDIWSAQTIEEANKIINGYLALFN